mgnify:CR=1 FL=1
MKYVDRLLTETDYLSLLEQLEELERDRPFCRHGLTHLLDTARIAWILVLEKKGSCMHPGNKEKVAQPERELAVEERSCDGEDIVKEAIYLAALLHDLGRMREYEDGTPHHIAGAAEAERLLARIRYPEERAEWILAAVAGHRRGEGGDSKGAGAWERGTEARNWECGTEAGDWENSTSARLAALLRWADKKSRNCFFCRARMDCNWKEEERNESITL